MESKNLRMSSSHENLSDGFLDTTQTSDKLCVLRRYEMAMHTAALTLFTLGSVLPGCWTDGRYSFGHYPTTLKILTIRQCLRVLRDDNATSIGKKDPSRPLAVTDDPYEDFLRWMYYLLFLCVLLAIGVGVLLSYSASRTPYLLKPPPLPLCRRRTTCLPLLFASACTVLLPYTGILCFAFLFPLECELPPFTQHAYRLGYFLYMAAIFCLLSAGGIQLKCFDLVLYGGGDHHDYPSKWRRRKQKTSVSGPTVFSAESGGHPPYLISTLLERMAVVFPFKNLAACTSTLVCLQVNKK